MKDFFAKHRHLIVIALIFAVILAALTPLVIPLGLDVEKKLNLSLGATRFIKLKAEKFQSVTVHCFEHENAELQFFRADNGDIHTQAQELDALCVILNDASLNPCDQKSSWSTLCTFSFNWHDESQVLFPESGDFCLLRHSGGGYCLRGTDSRGRIVHWCISKAAAQSLLAYRQCEVVPPQPENPRAQVCDTENISSVSLLTWENRTKTAPVELSRAQIETLCVFLELHLLPASHEGQNIALTHGENGWQTAMTAEDGTIWYVQYNDTQRCLSLSCHFPDGERQTSAATYSCEDEAVLASLPELLN